MKFLLVGSQVPEGVPHREFILPVALLYLASALRSNGTEISILDLNIGADKSGILKKRILDFKPSIVGISCMFSGQFSDVLEYASVVKQVTNVPVVIGGLHPTIYPSEILTHCPCVDFVILGEGEESVVQLVDALRGTRDFSEVDGLAYRSDGRVIVNEKRGFITDLDALPLPAYDLVDLSDYRRPRLPVQKWLYDSVPIISSRSCPMRCNFCSMFIVMGKRWRRRSPICVVDEIQVLCERYGQNNFSFMDDNLTLSKKHVLEICNLIVGRGLDIQFDCPNGLSMNTLDKEALDAMVEAGLVRVSLAIESGSEFIRNSVMKKGLSTEKIYEVVALTKKHENLYVRTFFLIGMPEETKKTLRETEEMIKAIDVDEPRVAIVVPFPGTALFDQALRDNLFTEDIDVDNLWNKAFFFAGESNRFFIKPYEMTMEELNESRRKMDNLTKELILTKAQTNNPMFMPRHS